MANIKDRIESIKPYFKGMQVQDVEGTSIIYVIVSFPPKWIIDKELEEKYNITVAKSDDGSYYFCGNMLEVGFDSIFDAIEFNINKMLSAQERAKLLKEKIYQLQELFMDESISLDHLRNIEFIYKPKKKTPKKKTEEPVVEENKEQEEVKEESYE